MRAEAENRRGWLLPACLLITLAVGTVFPGQGAQQPRASRMGEAAGPQVLALAPDADLPPSTPAFSPCGPDLVGRVVSTQGETVAGARVFIDAAGPRVGRGYTWPSCYADCRKSATADAQGKFKIESLSSNLLFRVVIAARGFEPATLTKVDPTQAPLAVQLKPRSKDQLLASQTVFGRVLDAHKRPVAGAAATIVGVTAGGGTSYGQQAKGTDVVAVSDSLGEFEIYVAKPFDSLELEIDAPGLARTKFAGATPGGARRDFALPVGAALIGRVVRDGTPMKGLNVGVASVDRSAGNFTGDFVVGTDVNGLFVFPSLPAERDYQFYGVMDSLRGIGALPARVVRVGRDGSRTDLGVLNLTPGWRVAGEVRVANAKTLPVGSRLILNREGAWDFSVIDLPSDGRFDLPNLPGEAVGLSVGMSGYRAAAGQPKLGRLEADRTGLLLLMEPGK